MMDFRQRIEQGRNKPVNSDLPDEVEDISYFATDRNGSPACLELRLPDGRRKAIPYSYFTEINFDSDKGINIVTSLKSIYITGRQLIRLFECLATYRVRYVAAHSGIDFEEDGLFVKEIRIEDL